MSISSVRIDDDVVVATRTFSELLKTKSIIFPDKSISFVIGRNGSGKTAFFKALCSFGPFRFKSNNTYFSGRFAYLDNDPLATLERNLLVKEVLDLFTRDRKATPDEIVSFGKDIGVASCTINKIRSGARLCELSAGQRQILFMLCAAYSKSTNWIFDECFSSLDPIQLKSAMSCVRFIVNNIYQSGGLIIASTHDYNVFSLLKTVCDEKPINTYFAIVKEGVLGTEGIASPLSCDEYRRLYE